MNSDHYLTPLYNLAAHMRKRMSREGRVKIEKVSEHRLDRRSSPMDARCFFRTRVRCLIGNDAVGPLSILMKNLQTDRKSVV